MDHWQRIFNYLSLPTTTTLYIGVGSSMSHYAEVTEQNNQQYPCFLNNFEGSHLVVLIDPCLESDLRLFRYFEQQGDPLTLVNQTNWDNTASIESSGLLTNNIKKTFPGSVVPLVREFDNSKGKFFAINDCFYPEVHPQMDDKHNIKASESVSILLQLVTIALSKVKPSKIIYQDYTGADTTNAYGNLFDIFGRDTILSNVCFDVSQHDGGCFIELRPDMIQLDESGNFVQEKYERLTKFPNSPNYLKSVKSRIDILAYPTAWNYIKLKESVSFEQVFVDRVKNLATIYGLEFDLSASRAKLCAQYLCILNTVIRDIVRSRDIDDSFADFLLGNLENRTEFNNAISILKFD
jgi:hypothetical protein